MVEEKNNLRKAVLAKRDEITPEDRISKSVLACENLWEHLSESTADVAGKTIAVYLSMKSELCLDVFIKQAYANEARICFPCMAKGNPSSVEKKRTNVSRETSSEAIEKSLANALSQEHLAREASSEIAGTEASVSAKEVDVPVKEGGHAPRPSMVFCEVSYEHYASGSIPFAQNPMRSYDLAGEELQSFPLVNAENIDIVIVPMVAFDDSFNRLGYGGGNYDCYLPNLRQDALIVGVAFEEQRVEEVVTEPHDQPLPLIISA